MRLTPLRGATRLSPTRPQRPPRPPDAVPGAPVAGRACASAPRGAPCAWRRSKPVSHPPATPETPMSRQASSDVVLPLDERMAGAPISWGVCEVPGWGWQYDSATVLAEMAECGLSATEFGPEGFLPDDPADRREALAAHDLQAVGQFVPVVLHDPDHDPRPGLERALEGLVAAGAATVVLAAASGAEGYDERPELDDAAWATLLRHLDEVADVVRER